MIEQLFKEKFKVQNEDVNEIIFSQYFLNCYQIVFINVMAFEIHGFLRIVNLGHEKQIIKTISLHLVN